MKRARIRHVAVDSFLEGQRALAAHVVSLPVPGPVGSFSPVFLVIPAADAHPVGRALIESREVSAQHDEIGTHRQSKGHVVVLHDASVRAYRDIDAGLLVVLVAGLADFDHSSRLSSADSLLFSGDADGTSADADLDEVRSGFRQEQESVLVHHVSGAYLDAVAVSLPYEIDRSSLPLGIAFRGVYAKNVSACLHQSRNSRLIVPGVDACSHHVPLLLVEELQRIGLVRVVVLAEDHIYQIVILVYDGQRVYLVVPDDVVGLFERDAVVADHQVIELRHEFRDGRASLHPAHPVIPAGHETAQFSVGRSVLRDGDGVVTCSLRHPQHITESVVGSEIAVAHHEPGLERLDSRHHRGFVFHRLGTVDEGHASLSCQGYGQPVAGDRLHYRRDQRDVETDLRLLAFSEFYKRCLQVDIVGDAFRRSISRDQKVFAECAAGFAVIICHLSVPPGVFVK